MSSDDQAKHGIALAPSYNKDCLFIDHMHSRSIPGHFQGSVVMTRRWSDKTGPGLTVAVCTFGAHFFALGQDI